MVSAEPNEPTQAQLDQAKATLRVGMYRAAQHPTPEIRAEFWRIFDELVICRLVMEDPNREAAKINALMDGDT